MVMVVRRNRGAELGVISEVIRRARHLCVCVEDEVGFGERRVLKKEGSTMGVDELMEWRWREKVECFIRAYSASA